MTDMPYLRMNDIIALMGDLPTLPGIAIKILDMIKKEEASLEAIGDILSKDPPLSAKVLKVANSPVYGFQGRVSSVLQAVKMLGTNSVKNLALSFSIVDKFTGSGNGFDYTRFWRNSLTTAVAAKLAFERIEPGMAEDAFFIGLLNDIGILVLNECIPDQYNLVLEERKIKDCSFQEAEDQILGFNHMDIGAYILSEWGLPESFTDSIRYHHCPEEISGGNIRLSRLLHISSLFAELFSAEEKGMPLGLIEHYINSYGFSEKLHIDEIVESISIQTSGIFPLFDIRGLEQKGFSHILEKAKIELFNLNNNLMESILKQQKLISELKKQVMRDSLTNLLNYKSLHEFLENELYRSRRYNHPLSMLMIDIDDFKGVNDSYGHMAGDNTLFCLAGLMTESFRKSDAIARYGGEEFAIVLSDTDVKGAAEMAERLRKAVQAMVIDFDNKKIRITVSIGFTTYVPPEDTEKTEIVKRADKALYKAKNTGKNRCCVLDEGSGL